MKSEPKPTHDQEIDLCVAEAISRAPAMTQDQARRVACILFADHG